jgi:hypothetical protein
MDESKLIVEVRETGNGWLVSFTKWDDTVEFVFARAGSAISMVKKVMTGQENPFAAMKGDSRE